MAQAKMEYMELVNSFYLAFEENKSVQEVEELFEELKDFGASDLLLGKAQAEASRLFAKNCF